MIGSVIQKAGPIAMVAVLVAYALTPSAKRELGPNDPIAADGSLAAGRGHTIFDSQPALGAYDPHPTSDDPADFEPLIKNERPFAQRDRAAFKTLLGRLDWSLCKGADRQGLIWAVRNYYEERGRNIRQFAARGPRAKAAIEAEWSTPDDREIDNYVQHALQYGILHISDVSANTYPEFARLFAGTPQYSAGCTAADNR
jgi:hypothetical protein